MNWITNLATLCVGLTILTSSSLGQAPPAKKFPATVANINGEQISGAELESIIKQMGPSPVQVPENTRKQIARDAMAMLIDDLLMQQFIRQNTAAIPEQALDQKMVELATELKKQGKTIQSLCNETQQTEAQLKRTMRLKLQWGNYAAAKIKDENVHNYYLHNKDFFDGTMVGVSLIIMRIPPGMSPSETAKLKAKMQDIRNQLLMSKMDFASAAKAYSQDASGPMGGNLGLIPRKYALEEPLASAAFKLAPGQISDVIETEMGIHLLRVNERKDGKLSDFTKIKDDVRDFCSEEFFQDTLTRQRKTARIEVFLP